MVTPFAILEPVLVGGVTIVARDAAQRGRGPAQGRARGRHGHRSARRRRDPGGRRTRCCRSARRARAVDVPDDVPLVRHRARAKEGEAYWRCPNKRGCPSQTIEWLSQLRLARRDGHRAPRLQDGDRAARPRLGGGSGRHFYALDAEQLAQLPGFKDKSIPNLLAAIEAVEGPAAVAAAGRAEHPPRRHATWRRCSPSAFGSIDALRAAVGEDINAVEGIGPEIASSVHAWFDDDGEPGSSRSSAPPASGCGTRRRTAEGQAAARRHDDRAHRQPRVHVAEEAPRRAAGRRRSRRLERLEEDRLRRRRARTPARRPRRPSSSASRSIDEQEFLKRLGRT